MELSSRRLWGSEQEPAIGHSLTWIQANHLLLCKNFWLPPSLRRPGPTPGLCANILQSPGDNFHPQDSDLTGNSCPQSPKPPKGNLSLVQDLLLPSSTPDPPSWFTLYGRHGRRMERGSQLAFIKQLFGLGTACGRQCKELGKLAVSQGGCK